MQSLVRQVYDINMFHRHLLRYQFFLCLFSSLCHLGSIVRFLVLYLLNPALESNLCFYLLFLVVCMSREDRLYPPPG